FDVQPEGNYVFIKGNAADPNADFLFAGQMDVLKGAIDSGAIKNVGEAYTDNWNPEVAQANMEQFLTANNNEVDAVVASNDGTAGGAIAALAAQGLAGAVPVSGQDGDHAALNRIAVGTQTVSVWQDARELGKKAAEVALERAGGASAALAAQGLPGTVPVSGQDGDHAALNRIALGTQTVSVWKDARELGKKAAEVALELAGGKALNEVTGVVPFSGGPKGVEMNAFFIAPVAVTQDNLNVVIDAGWVSKDVVCQGVAAGSV